MKRSVIAAVMFALAGSASASDAVVKPDICRHGKFDLDICGGNEKPDPPLYKPEREPAAKKPRCYPSWEYVIDSKGRSHRVTVLNCAF